MIAIIYRSYVVLSQIIQRYIEIGTIIISDRDNRRILIIENPCCAPFKITRIRSYRYIMV